MSGVRAFRGTGWLLGRDGYAVCPSARVGKGDLFAAPFETTVDGVFMNIFEGRVPEAAEDGDAVGIVVHGGAHEEKRPRVVAFVWGGKVRPTPSLPYGRWKKGVRPAA